MVSNETAVGRRGFYIVIEGSDSTGKSTQVDLLAKYLKDEFSLNVLVVSEPGGTPFAEEIRIILKNGSIERSAVANLLLFTAARYEMWRNEALPILKEGGVVLSARNYLSSLVYQGLAEGLGIEYVQQVTTAFMDKRYIEPDLSLILTLGESERISRLNQRGSVTKNPDAFEARDGDFQDSISRGYAEMSKRSEFVNVDASYTVDRVQRYIRKAVVRGMVNKCLT